MVSALATVATQERALLDQCEALLTCASSLQVNKYLHFKWSKKFIKTLNEQHIYILVPPLFSKA